MAEDLDRLREAARDAIDALIVATHAADGDEGDLGYRLVLTDWIVVGARRGFDEDGDPVSRVVLCPSGETPNYALLGLLHAARVMGERHYAPTD